MKVIKIKKRKEQMLVVVRETINDSEHDFYEVMTSKFLKLL